MMPGLAPPLEGAAIPRIPWDRIVPGIGLYVEAFTADATITSGHSLITVDATSGVVTITLPPVAECYREVTVKKTDAGANAVTVDGDGSETIDGAATATLAAQYDTITLIPDSAAGVWWTKSTI